MTTTPPDHVLVPREEKLLPCPFCGSKAIINGYTCSWHVDCDNEDCWASTSGVLFMEEAEARTAWNRRAAPSPPTSGGVNAGLLEALRPFAKAYDRVVYETARLTKANPSRDWKFAGGGWREVLADNIAPTWFRDAADAVAAISTAESAQAATAGDAGEMRDESLRDCIVGALIEYSGSGQGVDEMLYAVADGQATLIIKALSRHKDDGQLGD